ncbi:MAG TPA: hypothetical protein VHA52_10930, partial [Candidatus Babeliaceae bacterium]|nr:hypothetical protein [Candidatus Babeliaceae bacterium]
MALYSYQAFSKTGKKTKGTVDAASAQEARDSVSKLGLYPISIELVSEGARESLNWRSWFARSITIKDKIFFTKQLS